MLAMKKPTAMAAMIIVQVHVVEQKACMEVEDDDCTLEEVIEHLAVVLCRVIKQIEENPQNADLELQWTKDAGVHTVPPQFTEIAPGPSRRFVNLEENSAKFYFDLLFTDNIWKMLVRETNNN